MSTLHEPAHTYVDDESSLRDLVKALAKVHRVALDTEADSLHHYFEKVCLIQLTFKGRNYIVDPLAGLNLAPFFKTLAQKLLLVHGGEYDLRMMLSSFKFKPKAGMFDTMLAAQLVGSEQLGLVGLVEEYLGVELSKKGQRSDWSRRPLRESQLMYAVDDTRYLEALADRLGTELKRLGRLEWHREMCDHMIAFTQEEKPPADPERVWRIKGCRDLSNRQLAFVREIWYWRENEAQRADLPPFKVLGNQTIMDLTLWATTDKGRDLRKGPKLPRTCVGSRLSALQKALSKARKLPESQLPTQPKSSGVRPEYGPELDRIRAECNRVAEELGIESSLIAPRKTLETISLQKPGTLEEIQKIGQMMDWQLNLIGPAILDILDDTNQSD